MFLGYTKMRDVLLENRIQFYTESMKLQSQNTEYFKRLIENITDYSVIETNTINSLRNDTFDSSITNSLSDLRSINLDIIGATVYSYNGLRYESNNIYNFPTFNIFSKSKEYKTFQNQPQNDLWMLCTEDIPKYNYRTKKADVVSYIRRIFNSGEPIGIVIVNVATSSFMEYFSYDSFNSDFSLYVYTPGNIPVHQYGKTEIDLPDEAELKNLIFSGKQYLLSKDQKQLIIVENLFRGTTYVIKAISLDSFYAETNKLKAYFVIIAVLLVIALSFFYSRLEKKIFNPLMALQAKMAKYRRYP